MYNENWLIAFKNNFSRCFFALDSNGKSIPGRTKEKNWTTPIYFVQYIPICRYVTRATLIQLSTCCYYLIKNTTSKVAEEAVSTKAIKVQYYFDTRITTNLLHRIPQTLEGNLRLPSCFVSPLEFSVHRTR